MRTGAQALVCFTDSTNLWWLRPLRPGFRHCFVAVRQGPFWLIADPLSHCTQLRIEACTDLAGFYRRHHLTVIATQVRPPPPRPAPWRPFTCVEAVKRILGRHAPWVFTPWQLYQFLQIEENIP